ncbi:MAG TPA: rhodanese-like domain-containing protein [Noviherbaspirillum sp.]
MPAGEFEKKARFHAHDFSTPIAIYSGDDGDYRALVAAKNLREMGYTNVKYLEGGYESYTDQGLPVIDEGSRF